MGFSNVCVFVLHGLLVTAFPTGDYDGVDLGLLGVPVKGIAEFSGTVPASGSCSIVGHSPCSDLLPVSSPIVTPSNIVLESKDAIIYDTENDEDLVPINTEYDEAESNGKIPNTVILGALIADAIMKEKGAEVDATLAELDAFVEAEIANLGPLIQNALANTDTSEIDNCVDTALLEIESKIASELAMVDDFIEAELIRSEKLVESVTDNADQIGSLFTIAQCLLSGTNITELKNANMTEKETLVAMELAMLESFLESQLAKAEAIVESELEKVNSFVESELAKVDGIVESELAKVDLFVETELVKTDAVVKSELLKMESYFVDAELAKVDMSVEEPAGFSNVPLACGTATTDESCSYRPILPNSEIHADDVTQSDSRVYISGTFPVSGRTLIIGSTGCPPIIPTHEPLPLHVESFPVIETIHYDYDDSYGDIAEKVHDDKVESEFEVPVVEGGVFSSEVPAEDSSKISGVNPSSDMCYDKLWQKLYEDTSISDTDAIKPQITTLPPVNIRNMTPGDGKVAIIGGNLQFSGTATASGGTSLYAEFPCPPLTATKVGPNGKKYIWISKKPAKNVPLPRAGFGTRPPTPPRPRTDFPTYPADFPETVIMDSTKNYEKLMSEDLDVDLRYPRPVPVAGDAIFEGTVPAYGSVSITGHCA